MSTKPCSMSCLINTASEGTHTDQVRPVCVGFPATRSNPPPGQDCLSPPLGCLRERTSWRSDHRRPPTILQQDNHPPTIPVSVYENPHGLVTDHVPFCCQEPQEAPRSSHTYMYCLQDLVPKAGLNVIGHVMDSSLPEPLMTISSISMLT